MSTTQFKCQKELTMPGNSFRPTYNSAALYHEWHFVATLLHYQAACHVGSKQQ